jgi:hypothetical protein
MSMRLRTCRVSRSACVAFILIFTTLGPWNFRAQTPAPASTLEGVVVDPSGARVPHAAVQIRPDDTSLHIKTLETDSVGRFATVLPHGTYTVTVKFPGFEPFHSTLTITAQGPAVHLEVSLAIPALLEEVVVDPDGENSAENKGAFVLSGKDLNIFSNDNATFQKEIEAMAGSDPKGPHVYVNGFSGSRFPPKNTIASIRLNRNPYSALFDQYGIGRIEIFTKPGTDKLHGEFDSTGNDINFNAPNPYAGTQPPYYSFTEQGDLNGPIGKKTSFFLAGVYNNQQNNAAVHAFTLDPTTLDQIQFAQAVPDPVTESTYSLRLDRLFTPNNTFTGSYQYDRITTHNGSVGLLTLANQGFNSGLTTQTLQLSDSQMIGVKMVSETRFQYLRTHLSQDPVSDAASILVEGAFNDGGNPQQQLHDNQDFYEFQQLVSRQQGTHFLRFGGRYRLYRDANLSRANYNGQFYFPSLTAYQITRQVLQANADSQDPITDPATLDATVRSTCDPQPSGPPVCGGATQYSITTGQPSANVLTGDLGVFAEDEWKYSKFLTFDLGFRFESQSAVPDHIDPAPRFGVAWTLYRKKRPWVVLRGGAGVFYDRFQAANLLTAIRQNGVTQQTFVAQNPFYPTPALTAVPATPYTLDPHLRTEYGILAGGSAEHIFGKLGRSSITFTNVRGDHQYISRNINAPLPGTFDANVPGSGVRPLGGDQNIYQFGSGGVANFQSVRVTSVLNVNKRVRGFVIYTANRERSDANTASTFASNSFNIAADYGRVALVTQSLTVGSTEQLPFGITANIYIGATGGVPFNITTGSDLNGDTIYNDRPAFATDLTRASVIKTRFGNFDTVPIAGQTIIPINYGNSPASILVDPTLERSFAFGPRPAAAAAAPGAKPGPRPDPPFNLSISVEAQNVLNHVNPGTPIGVLTSPFFGKSISLSNGSTISAANRVILLHMNFSF